MKMTLRLMLVSLLVVVAAPSYSGEAWHVSTCEILDGTTEDQVMDLLTKWTKAIQSMKGGEKVEVSVAFPAAAQMGESDFRATVKFPTFQDFGVFWDSYGDSPAGLVEEESRGLIDCPDSRLFEVETIK
jgi:hypothetical protein